MAHKPAWLADVCDTISFWIGPQTQLQLNTSGSTGQPKTIFLEKSVLLHSAKTTNSFFGLNSKTSALLALPAAFIGGKMMIIRALVGGFNLNLIAPKASVNCNQKNFDFVALTPQQAAASLPYLAHFKIILLGGAAISESLENQILTQNKNAFHSYGMTETASHIAVRALGERFYNALPGVTFSLKKDCLIIHAPAWQQQNLETNDVVALQSSTSFEWLGRADFVINSGGIKLHPEIIEKKLENILENRFFITKIPHSVLGEALVLVIESAQKKAYDLDFLPKYERPKEVFFTAKFVETSSGKLDRQRTLDLVYPF